MTAAFLVTRVDALPEHARYVDDGCNLAPRCLECPFERCRYDVAGGAAAMRARRREREALQLRAAGLTADEIAERIGTSKRTVWRVLAGGGGQ